VLKRNGSENSPVVAPCQDSGCMKADNSSSVHATMRTDAFEICSDQDVFNFRPFITYFKVTAMINGLQREYHP
jgi:hypothetical protein